MTFYTLHLHGPFLFEQELTMKTLFCFAECDREEPLCELAKMSQGAPDPPAVCPCQSS
jgi:hypothetical protein